MSMTLTVNGTDFVQFLAPGGLNISTVSRGKIEIEYLDGSIGVGRTAVKKTLSGQTRLLTQTELEAVKTALSGSVATVSYTDPLEGTTRSNVSMSVSDVSAATGNYGGRIMYGPVSFTLTEV